MPRDGAVVLSDVRNPTLLIVEPCDRRGTYNVARLMEQHGDAKALLDVGAVLLGGVSPLFLRVMAWRAKRRRIVP
jgi:hypothetical protein